MTKGELKSRYRSAYFGFSWTLINPLIMMLTFYFLWKLGITRIDISNYPLFLLAGLFPWAFTTSSLSTGSSSLRIFANLIKKVYFPREAVPLSQVFANGFNFLVSLALLLILMLFFPVKWSPAIFFCPVILLVQFMFTVGIVLWGAMICVYFRDVQFLINAIILPWFFATPIFYPASLVPERFRNYLYINPMAGIIEMYRSVLLYGRMPEALAFESSLLIAAAFFVTGVYAFGAKEKNFADLV